MLKDTLIKTPLLFIRPKKYFKEVIGGKLYKVKDLVYFGLVLFPILMILHIFESKTLSRYGSGLEIGIYLFAFVLGLVVSLIFRTYFLSMVLNKTGTEVDYRIIGMIVSVAMISNLLMILIPTIIQTSDYNQFIEIIMRVWNLTMILIGIVCIYKINWIKGMILILIMFGFEMMFIYVIGGVRL
jgi:hypothetical protein